MHLREEELFRLDYPEQLRLLAYHQIREAEERDRSDSRTR